MNQKINFSLFIASISPELKVIFNPINSKLSVLSLNSVHSFPSPIIDECFIHDSFFIVKTCHEFFSPSSHLKLVFPSK